MKIETRVNWLFADDVAKAKSVLLQYVEQKAYEKGGYVMLFLGQKGEMVGDYQTFPSNIRNLKELIAKYGDDDTQWKGKIFSVSADSESKKLIFTPI